MLPRIGPISPPKYGYFMGRSGDQYFVIARESNGEDSIVFEAENVADAKDFCLLANQMLQEISQNHESLFDIGLCDIALCLRSRP